VMRTYPNFGRALKQSRLDLGITQTALAEHLGFTAQFLGRIEGGFVPVPDGVGKNSVSYFKCRGRSFRNTLWQAMKVDSEENAKKKF
jgi:transcriptional regulator with XRE-family HTH domain